MNAVIGLCHFCELHGPSILFYTQPFHCSNHTPDQVLNGVAASPSLCGISQNRLHSGSFSKETVKKDDEKQKVRRTSSGSRHTTCEACRSLNHGEPGFLSIDKESHISYISMQYPEEQELYSILRHACVRSLSCEVCPGREGPIMFGDEASGYVFSYTFFLKDLQSRGFQRWYSLICVMMDRIYLANSWQFLISNFKSIIDDMQSKAEQVYKTEHAEKPQREALLQPRNAFMTPDQFRRARGGQVYRSLMQITKDKNIFQNLHQSFSWILKASGQRFTEKLLEGPPVEDYLYDEDEVEPPLEELQAMALSPYPDSSEGPVFESIGHVYKVLGDRNFHVVAFHVVRGDQLVVQGENEVTVKSMLKVLKQFIPAGCFRALYYEKEYQDSWRCNFLGLSLGVEIPFHVLQSQLFVQVKIIDKENGGESAETSSKSHFSFCENSFDSYQFEVSGNSVGNEPTYLKHIMKALRNNTINRSVFDLMLITAKEQWMGKVKVMFKFSKSGVRTTKEKDRLLEVLQAKSEDEILLKYWMTSLSRSYRSHLLNCSNHKGEL